MKPSVGRFRTVQMKRFSRVPRFWRKFREGEEGAVVVETALMIPLFILILFGALELGRFILAHQKMQAAASLAADIAAQTEDALSEGQVSDILAALDDVVSPFPFDSRARLILTGLQGDSRFGNTVRWQRCSGSLARSSRYGGPGSKQVALPAGLVLAPGDTLVVAEIYYNYAPLFAGNGIVASRDLYHQALFRPRYGALDRIVNDGTPPATCGG
ncbi:MAG: pilus assembly protein [Alphaproteobacteria bacterium]|nr:MAG: pilus assembly protein [Alphaproteobacteria bacterium]